MADNMYFAAKDPKDTAAIVIDKCNFWFNLQSTNGLLDKIRASYYAYHGSYYDDTNGGHTVTFGGEQGEFTQVAVNHYRNIAQHMLVNTTSSRPAMDTRAVNTDYKSLVQTELANGILDYYMREKKLEDFIKRGVEYSIIMGAGYIKLEWDSNAGEVYDYELNEETGERDPLKPIHEGDIKFRNLSPLDIVFDSTKETSDHDWVVTRTFKNKYDLAAKYPEMKDQIERLTTKGDSLTLSTSPNVFNEQTDDVPVYEFYHRKTEALNQGRYILFLDSDIILYDGPIPYKRLPIIRIAASDFLGTPFGYTAMFDLLPLQEAVNSLYSTILTNQSAFGVQNIYVPRGADISYQSLEGGLNIIEGNAQAGKPESMNLTQTPAEIFKFLEILTRDMETLSGVNSVARGNPEASLRSGAALALVQSLALQFSSNLQSAYIQCIEDLGTQIIELLQQFAVAKRAVTLISGKSNKTYVEEFNSDDISAISRVVVDVGNPLARTTSGKLQMAESLLQYQAIQDPQQYLSIVNTGKLEVATESTEHVFLTIRSENERMVAGKTVIAVAVDRHSKHIMQHASVLSDPELRFDAELVKRVTAHIQEHINLLKTTDPAILAMIGEQAIPQDGGAQGGPQQPQQGPQASVPGSEAIPNVQQPVPMAGQPEGPGQIPSEIMGPGLDQSQPLPNVPSPPAPFNNLPTNPAAIGG